MKKVALNSIYGIRNDKTCSFIYTINTSFDTLTMKLPKALEVPSLYGYILSYFQNPCYTEEAITKISKDSNIKEEVIFKFIDQIIDRKNALKIYYNNEIFILPPNLLVTDFDLSHKANVFTEKDFNPKTKFIKSRPSSPAKVTIMLTTKCNTDCIYCYADRTEKIDFELEKILSLIKDCYSNGVLNINLSGGDIFAYKDWRTVIKTMHDYNYISLISTKIPLTKNDLIFLKENGIKELQFSLDSAFKREISTLIKREDSYIEKVKNMLSACKELKLRVNIRTVLTKFNSKEDTLQSLYNLISDYQVYSWTIVPASYSYYKEGYKNYQADYKTIRQCYDYINQLSLQSDIKISTNKLEKGEKINIKYTNIEDFLNQNKGCFITSHYLSINVYGQVTLCEMLYNRSKYHLGNAKEQTIKELWNSDLVRDFFNFKLHSMPKNPESPCYQCNSYSRCKIGNSKKVCLVDIVNAYGEDKWDYPDPRCPHASKYDMDLLIK
ncbi:radical SAM protein [Parabacteroides distasonis]|jgi:MoaA/NifB/PqqE/SkfB family radical SAM enzyme|uniref:radical SAM protein n=1 Tax=Parabacteroides distasonis TaxID=823 RepID=UPI00189E4F7A|nr:radical SAM protein [Parabacteroides distasonis]MDB9152316.1 radical SAM protein [Parabacteroides distasonis]MDB9156872.1 radical SAM protein [Parabacteroides distasonis]MDB9165572.1 radical SAM protein [Parabacteroides distasonis]MDB9170404.1 radical SAM protein [Parabacteroides distasonis]MDB9193320.1 radical SAM protein [Parabacteroides distasonis]